MRTAERARQRKELSDRGEQVVVGVNYFRRPGEDDDVSEVFRLDPQSLKRVSEKYEELKARRDNGAVKRSLARLEQAAAHDAENLLPYLIDCCHAYCTVGEMVMALKRQWGEFQEPIRF